MQKRWPVKNVSSLSRDSTPFYKKYAHGSRWSFYIGEGNVCELSQVLNTHLQTWSILYKYNSCVAHSDGSHLVWYTNGNKS